MRYEFRFSTDPEEDPEVLKMLIDANNRSDLLYNILNNKWETSQVYFDDDEILELMQIHIFDMIMDSGKSTYDQDRYDFLKRCQFKLDLRRFLGENTEGSLRILLHVFGQAVCEMLYEESGGLNYEYEFLER